MIDDISPNVDVEDMREFSKLKKSRTSLADVPSYYHRLATKYDHIWTDGDLWESLTSRQFENVVGCLYEEQGYDVTITQESSDGGADVIASGQTETILVEAKNRHKGSSISVNVLKKLHSTAVNPPYSEVDNVDEIHIVASCGYSTPAVREAETIHPQMGVRLIDVDELVFRLNRFNIEKPE